MTRAGYEALAADLAITYRWLPEVERPGFEKALEDIERALKRDNRRFDPVRFREAATALPPPGP